MANFSVSETLRVMKQLTDIQRSQVDENVAEWRKSLADAYVQPWFGCPPHIEYYEAFERIVAEVAV